MFVIESRENGSLSNILRVSLRSFANRSLKECRFVDDKGGVVLKFPVVAASDAQRSAQDNPKPSLRSQ